jgi:hypothetical protein
MKTNAPIHMQRITYYAIVPQMTPRIASSLLHQDEKSDVFLSPHLRLCGYTAMAHIDSESLARAFAEACSPFLRKRYGIETTLMIESRWEVTGSDKILKRIQDDSEIIRKRLATGNFSPNKARSNDNQFVI